jgi:hypothetical protein
VDILTELLQGVALPKMVKIRQHFAVHEVQDSAGTLRKGIYEAGVTGRIKSGMRVAVAVGSRGMAELPLLVKVVVEEIRNCGAVPFLVPAMGSHGGATAEGQVEMLASLGVTESSVGCPIVSSMDVVEIGVLDNGLAVLLDKNAFEADGIVLINRIKPHTAFVGTYESGLVKMMAIGLGKHQGAASCHALGFKHMAENIFQMARVHLQKANYLFGVATVENAYDRIDKIAVVPAADILAVEPGLLAEAKKNMPRILLQPIDVLIVDQLGKEFSGGGMDPNVTGGGPLPSKHRPARLVALDLTERSHGNAIGVGNAHFTTRRLFEKIDLAATYANCITATIVESGRIPLIMESDSLAIKGAVKTCKVADPEKVRIVRISNTLHLSEIYVSENMTAEAEQHPDVTVAGQPAEWLFDADGNLPDIGRW